MNPYEGLGDLGASGAHLPGPPWILGHRGTPREAPENTLSGLRRAIELGLDGVEYDLRACATGEPVLLHDADLARTTDHSGLLRDHSLPELFGVDAGSWFSRTYRGEPVPLFDEALEVVSGPASSDGPGDKRPWHMIELKERGLVAPVAEALAELGIGREARAGSSEVRVRVASFDRGVMLEARDAGLPTMLLGVDADLDDLRFARDERLTALGLGPRGWTPEALAVPNGKLERWAWSLDEPDDLLSACRAGLVGFNTNEPHRALAVRALMQLAPNDDGPYPLDVPVLEIEPEALAEDTRGRGEWYGDWAIEAEVRNPFPFEVDVRCGIFVRSGAFEIEGLPQVFDLAPGERQRVRARLTGGGRLPGPDPLFGVLFRWRSGTIRTGEDGTVDAGGQLLLDAPLRRERVTTADGLSRRLMCLRDSPSEPQASLTLRRDRGSLLLSVEDPGPLDDPHVIARLDGETVRGGAGLRLQLPAGFDSLTRGIPFSCGIEGRDLHGPRLLRWAGGLPGGIGHGAAGRLVPQGKA